jgi:hypothetical protein
MDHGCREEVAKMHAHGGTDGCMTFNPNASTHPDEASKLLAADGALFNFKFLFQMYSIGLLAFFALFFTHREEG